MELLSRYSVVGVDALAEGARSGLAASLAAAKRVGQVSGRGSLAALSLSDRPIRDYRDLAHASRFDDLHRRLHLMLLARGLLVSTTLGFALSTAMDETHVDRAVQEVGEALREL